MCSDNAVSNPSKVDYASANLLTSAPIYEPMHRTSHSRKQKVHTDALRTRTRTHALTEIDKPTHTRAICTEANTKRETKTYRGHRKQNNEKQTSRLTDARTE